MAQQVRMRQQGSTIDFSANNKQTVSLARGMIYREIYLRLQGAPTVSAINNTAANTKKGDEWAVVKKIELVANGTDVLKSIDGNALWWLNYFLYGVPPQITVALGDAATADVPFDSVLILPLWMPRSIRPIDTALDSRNLSSLELAITWGQYTDINGSATAWITEPTVEVYTLESFNVSGPFSQWRVFTIEKEITATNSRFQIQLPVGKMFRGFLINTEDGGADQGDVVNNFKLISGTTVFADLSAGDDVLHQITRLRNGIARFYDDGAGAYDNLRRGDNNSLDGWYLYDHVTDGFMTEAIDTLGFSEFIMELDVTVGAGTTKVLVYPFEIVPVRGGAT